MYVLLVALAVATAMAWAVFLTGGGLSKIYAWLTLMQLLPAAAFLVLLWTVIAVIVRRKKAGKEAIERRRRLHLIATLVVAVTSSWPAL